MARKKKNSIRKRIVGAYVSSILSISLVLTLVGISALLLLNTGTVSDYLKENLVVSVILKDDVSEEQGSEYALELADRPYVVKASFIDREQGTEELESMLGEDFLSVFETSPVPISVDLNIKAEYMASDSLNVIREAISKEKPVEEVVCQQGLIEALSSNMHTISLVLLIGIAVLLFISLILINNVVRLHVFAKRFSISTMKLVGATRSFIRRPFIGRAALQGFAAALIAIGIIAVLLYWMHSSLPQVFAIMRPRVFAEAGAIVLGAGVLICVVGTFFDVNKLLSMSKNELYG